MKLKLNYGNAMSLVSTSNLSNITVAVVDTGLFPHTDIPSRLGGYNAHTGMTPSQMYGDHGTLVAGVIGATTNNGKGIAGVASGVKIMPVSICDTENATRLGMSASTSAHFANAIRWAANNGARVINNSWSFGTSSSPDPDVNNAITYAHGKGCVVVFASGNNHPTLAVKQPQAGAPSATLVVGAINQNGSRASYSGYGPSLDVVAPGTGIWTTTWTGGYSGTVSGTSLAAPHVSGIAALILSANPTLTQQQVVDAIIKSGSTYPSWNSQTGYGLVDATDAVLGTISGPDNPLYNTNTVYSILSSYITGVSVSWSVLPSGSATVSGSGNSATIKFNVSGGNCTVQAHITVPGGATRTVSKTVSLKPHVPILHYTGMPYGITTPTTIRFTVTNAHPNATYEWDPTQGVIMYATDDHMYVETPYVPFNNNTTYGSYIIVRCRALIAGAYSDWSPDYYMRIKYLE